MRSLLEARFVQRLLVTACHDCNRRLLRERFLSGATQLNIEVLLMASSVYLSVEQSFIQRVDYQFSIGENGFLSHPHAIFQMMCKYCKYKLQYTHNTHTLQILLIPMATPHTKMGTNAAKQLYEVK